MQTERRQSEIMQSEQIMQSKRRQSEIMHSEQIMQSERRQSEIMQSEQIMQSERRQSEIMQSECRQSENRRTENVQSANLSLPRDSSALATLRRLYVLRDAWIPVLKKEEEGRSHDRTVEQTDRNLDFGKIPRDVSRRQSSYIHHGDGLPNGQRSFCRDCVSTSLGQLGYHS